MPTEATTDAVIEHTTVTNVIARPPPVCVRRWWPHLKRVDLLEGRRDSVCTQVPDRRAPQCRAGSHRQVEQNSPARRSHIIIQRNPRKRHRQRPLAMLCAISRNLASCSRAPRRGMLTQRGPGGTSLLSDTVCKQVVAWDLVPNLSRPPTTLPKLSRQMHTHTLSTPRAQEMRPA